MTDRPSPPRRLVVGALGALFVACGDTSPGADGATPTSAAVTPSAETTPIEVPPVDGPYDWEIDPTDFVAAVDNPYFPLTPGTVLVYEGRSGGEPEVVRVRVTGRTKEILGLAATVVRDTVTVAGEVHEDTFDWYAQDVDGNVWYLGEATKEYEEGKVVSTEGSWEAGVDGALPGVIMPAQPVEGLAYTQEHYAGEAEDKGRVIRLGEQVNAPAGSYDDVLVTEDWTPLEPKVRENKYYAPGVGVVFEEIVRGGEGVLRLVEIRHAT
ncbi:MAG TPA: hypothetical protein VFZ75_13260 [Actinomycetota bacterium]|nr:hypothetical protein [Actinomycetota bacterium]